MGELVQIVINGLIQGGVYACVGVGLSLIYGSMRIINAAHGAAITLGAYVTYSLWRGTGLDPFAVLPLTAVVLFVVGWGLQKGIVNYFVGAHLVLSVAVTFGIGLVLVNVVLAIWSREYLSLSPSYVGSSVAVGPVVVPVVRLAIMVTALAAVGALALLLKKTRLGSAILAVSQNQDGARLSGISVEHIYAVTAGIATALAGVAGGLLGLLQPISPLMGSHYLTLAFLVAVLGGFGDITGAFWAGLVLGLVQNLVGSLAGPTYQEFGGVFLLLVILCFRPSGLRGKAFFGH